MEGFAYFPAIVYRDERVDLVDQTLPVCMDYLSCNRDEDIKLRQSSSLIYDPAMRHVADYLLVSAVTILREQGYAVDNYDFYLSGLWAQEIQNGASTNVHVHKNSQISGWMFLETPENGAYPIYYDTRMNKAMAELDFVEANDISNATNAIHFNNIRPGTVLFSNSWMQHQLVGGNSDQPTRCLHFIVAHKDKPCSTC